jgi:hypothetical protein
MAAKKEKKNTSRGKKDPAPQWVGYEMWSADQFTKHFHFGCRHIISGPRCLKARLIME